MRPDFYGICDIGLCSVCYELFLPLFSVRLYPRVLFFILFLSLFFHTACYVFLLSSMYPVRPPVAYYPRYRSRACLPECVRAAPLHVHDHLARFLGDLLESRSFSRYLIFEFLYYNISLIGNYLHSLHNNILWFFIAFFTASAVL